jgi:hypothetical protein
MSVEERPAGLDVAGLCENFVPMRSALARRFAILACAAGLALLGAAPASAATTFTPNTFGDPVGANHCTPPLPSEGCSLRGAIEDAQTGDTVQLGAGTYKLAAPGELALLKNITIVGAGAAATTIEQTAVARVMRVESGLTMSGVTITGGEIVGKAGEVGSIPSPEGHPGGSVGGAGIEAGGPVTLTDVVVTGNRAVGGAGGEGGQGSGNGNGGKGGPGGDVGGVGIDGGPLVLTRVAVTDNFAQPGAGGTGGFGAGTGDGGAGGTGGTTVGAGIAVGHASLIATDTLIADNTAATGPGGVGGLGGISAGAGGAGGAGEASDGGGIFSNGLVELTNVTLTGNVVDGGTGGTGGAAFNTGGAGGKGGNGFGAAGGAISLLNGATGNFASVTIAGNTATGGSAGAGGVVIGTGTSGPGGTPAPSEGGDIFVYGGNMALASSLTLRDTIIAAGSAGAGHEDCSVRGEAKVISLGHNLEEHHQCIATPAVGDLRNTAAGLGPLAANGGPTETMALLPGSAAIDAGESACVGAEGSPLHEDQRGDPRGTPCDIGAFEVQPPPPPPSGSGSGGGGTSNTQPGTGSSAGKPSLSGLKLAPSAVRDGKKVKVSFRLSADAPVTFTLRRELPGVKAGRKCVPPGRSKSHKHCTRPVGAKGGPSSTKGTAGSDSVSWVPKGLKPGHYALTASATGGNAATVKFVVQAAKKPKH